MTSLGSYQCPGETNSGLGFDLGLANIVTSTCFSRRAFGQEVKE